VFFNTESYDPIYTHLCRETGCLVVSVGYRLSPEAKFPDAVNDCLEATRWVGQHVASLNGNPDHLFIAGDSAGGNLAAVTAIRIRDEGGPAIKGQVLIYPVTDHFKRKKQSAITFADGFNLSDEDMHWFWNHYLAKEEDADNPLASPLIAETLTNLPPAFLIVSGHDPLRDEGLEYAQKLMDAGVPVRLSVYGEMIHGFISYLGILRQGLEAIREIADWIDKRSMS
jgi:acetyl esterase